MPDTAARLMVLHTVLGDDALRFRSLSAAEEPGRPFEFVVGALSDDSAIAFPPSWRDMRRTAAHRFISAPSWPRSRPRG